jgi:hypothetical protein
LYQENANQNQLSENTVSSIKLLMLFEKFVLQKSKLENLSFHNHRIVSLQFYSYLTDLNPFVSNFFGLEQWLRDKMKEFLLKESLSQIFHKWSVYSGVIVAGRNYYRKSLIRKGLEKWMEFNVKLKLRRKNALELFIWKRVQSTQDSIFNADNNNEEDISLNQYNNRSYRKTMQSFTPSLRKRNNNHPVSAFQHSFKRNLFYQNSFDENDDKSDFLIDNTNYDIGNEATPGFSPPKRKTPLRNFNNSVQSLSTLNDTTTKIGGKSLVTASSFNRNYLTSFSVRDLLHSAQLQYYTLHRDTVSSLTPRKDTNNASSSQMAMAIKKENIGAIKYYDYIYAQDLIYSLFMFRRFYRRTMYYKKFRQVQENTKRVRTQNIFQFWLNYYLKRKQNQEVFLEPLIASNLRRMDKNSVRKAFRKLRSNIRLNQKHFTQFQQIRKKFHSKKMYLHSFYMITKPSFLKSFLFWKELTEETGMTKEREEKVAWFYEDFKRRMYLKKWIARIQLKKKLNILEIFRVKDWKIIESLQYLNYPQLLLKHSQEKKSGRSFKNKLKIGKTTGKSDFIDEGPPPMVFSPEKLKLNIKVPKKVATGLSSSQDSTVNDEEEDYDLKEETKFLNSMKNHVIKYALHLSYMKRFLLLWKRKALTHKRLFSSIMELKFHYNFTHFSDLSSKQEKAKYKKLILLFSNSLFRREKRYFYQYIQDKEQSNKNKLDNNLQIQSIEQQESQLYLLRNHSTDLFSDIRLELEKNVLDYFKFGAKQFSEESKIDLSEGIHAISTRELFHFPAALLKPSYTLDNMKETDTVHHVKHDKKVDSRDHQLKHAHNFLISNYSKLYNYYFQPNYSSYWSEISNKRGKINGKEIALNLEIHDENNNTPVSYGEYMESISKKQKMKESDPNSSVLVPGSVTYHYISLFSIFIRKWKFFTLKQLLLKRKYNHLLLLRMKKLFSLWNSFYHLVSSVKKTNKKKLFAKWQKFSSNHLRFTTRGMQKARHSLCVRVFNQWQHYVHYHYEHNIKENKIIYNSMIKKLKEKKFLFILRKALQHFKQEKSKKSNKYRSSSAAASALSTPRGGGTGADRNGFNSPNIPTAKSFFLNRSVDYEENDYNEGLSATPYSTSQRAPPPHHTELYFIHHNYNERMLKFLQQRMKFFITEEDQEFDLHLHNPELLQAGSPQQQHKLKLFMPANSPSKKSSTNNNLLFTTTFLQNDFKAQQDQELENEQFELSSSLSPKLLKNYLLSLLFHFSYISNGWKNISYFAKVSTQKRLAMQKSLTWKLSKGLIKFKSFHFFGTTRKTIRFMTMKSILMKWKFVFLRKKIYERNLLGDIFDHMRIVYRKKIAYKLYEWFLVGRIRDALHKWALRTKECAEKVLLLEERYAKKLLVKFFSNYQKIFYLNFFYKRKIILKSLHYYHYQLHSNILLKKYNKFLIEKIYLKSKFFQSMLKKTFIHKRQQLVNIRKGEKYYEKAVQLKYFSLLYFLILKKQQRITSKSIDDQDERTAKIDNLLEDEEEDELLSTQQQLLKDKKLFSKFLRSKLFKLKSVLTDYYQAKYLTSQIIYWKTQPINHKNKKSLVLIDSLKKKKAILLKQKLKFHFYCKYAYKFNPQLMELNEKIRENRMLYNKYYLGIPLTISSPFFNRKKYEKEKKILLESHNNPTHHAEFQENVFTPKDSFYSSLSLLSPAAVKEKEKKYVTINPLSSMSPVDPTRGKSSTTTTAVPMSPYQMIRSPTIELKKEIAATYSSSSEDNDDEDSSENDEHKTGKNGDILRSKQNRFQKQTKNIFTKSGRNLTELAKTSVIQQLRQQEGDEEEANRENEERKRILQRQREQEEKSFEIFSGSFILAKQQKKDKKESQEQLKQPLEEYVSTATKRRKDLEEELKAIDVELISTEEDPFLNEARSPYPSRSSVPSTSVRSSITTTAQSSRYEEEDSLPPSRHSKRSTKAVSDNRVKRQEQGQEQGQEEGQEEEKEGEEEIIDKKETKSLTLDELVSFHSSPKPLQQQRKKSPSVPSRSSRYHDQNEDNEEFPASPLLPPSTRTVSSKSKKYGKLDDEIEEEAEEDNDMDSFQEMMSRKERETPTAVSVIILTDSKSVKTERTENKKKNITPKESRGPSPVVIIPVENKGKNFFDDQEEEKEYEEEEEEEIPIIMRSTSSRPTSSSSSRKISPNIDPSVFIPSLASSKSKPDSLQSSTASRRRAKDLLLENDNGETEGYYHEEEEEGEEREEEEDYHDLYSSPTNVAPPSSKGSSRSGSSKHHKNIDKMEVEEEEEELPVMDSIPKERSTNYNRKQKIQSLEIETNLFEDEEVENEGKNTSAKKSVLSEKSSSKPPSGRPTPSSITTGPDSRKSNRSNTNSNNNNNQGGGLLASLMREEDNRSNSPLRKSLLSSPPGIMKQPTGSANTRPSAPPSVRNSYPNNNNNNNNFNPLNSVQSKKSISFFDDTNQSKNHRARPTTSVTPRHPYDEEDTPPNPLTMSALETTWNRSLPAPSSQSLQQQRRPLSSASAVSVKSVTSYRSSSSPQTSRKASPNHTKPKNNNNYPATDRDSSSFVSQSRKSNNSPRPVTNLSQRQQQQPSFSSRPSPVLTPSSRLPSADFLSPKSQLTDDNSYFFPEVEEGEYEENQFEDFETKLSLLLLTPEQIKEGLAHKRRNFQFSINKTILLLKKHQQHMKLLQQRITTEQELHGNDSLVLKQLKGQYNFYFNNANVPLIQLSHAMKKMFARFFYSAKLSNFIHSSYYLPKKLKKSFYQFYFFTKRTAYVRKQNSLKLLKLSMRNWLKRLAFLKKNKLLIYKFASSWHLIVFLKFQIGKWRKRILRQSMGKDSMEKAIYFHWKKRLVRTMAKWKIAAFIQELRILRKGRKEGDDDDFDDYLNKSNNNINEEASTYTSMESTPHHHNPYYRQPITPFSHRNRAPKNHNNTINQNMDFYFNSHKFFNTKRRTSDEDEDNGENDHENDDDDEEDNDDSSFSFRLPAEVAQKQQNEKFFYYKFLKSVKEQNQVRKENKEDKKRNKKRNTIATNRKSSVVPKLKTTDEEEDEEERGTDGQDLLTPHSGRTIHFAANRGGGPRREEFDDSSTIRTMNTSLLGTRATQQRVSSSSSPKKQREIFF